MFKRVSLTTLGLGALITVGCSEGRHGMAFRGPEKEVELGYDVEVDPDGSRDVEWVSDVDNYGEHDDDE
jgi:hypothetical protein